MTTVIEPLVIIRTAESVYPQNKRALTDKELTALKQSNEDILKAAKEAEMENQHTLQGYLVTKEISGAHPKMDYTLLDGDLLVLDRDGTYMKECPGIAIGGFTFTDEQKTTLKPVQFTRYGLEYTVYEDTNE